MDRLPSSSAQNATELPGMLVKRSVASCEISTFSADRPSGSAGMTKSGGSQISTPKSGNVVVVGTVVVVVEVVVVELLVVGAGAVVHAANRSDKMRRFRMARRLGDVSWQHVQRFL